jgi:hypothetical protein
VQRAVADRPSTQVYEKKNAENNASEATSEPAEETTKEEKKD